MKDNIDDTTGLTLKSLSSTRWKSRINSVKAIRFQVSNIREALLQVSDIDNDPKTSSEAKSLANNELGDFEFLVAIVIWYDCMPSIWSARTYNQRICLLMLLLSKCRG